MDFSKIKKLDIPEGTVRSIYSSGTVLWTTNDTSDNITLKTPDLSAEYNTLIVDDLDIIAKYVDIFVDGVNTITVPIEGENVVFDLQTLGCKPGTYAIAVRVTAGSYVSELSDTRYHFVYGGESDVLTPPTASANPDTSVGGLFIDDSESNDGITVSYAIYCEDETYFSCAIKQGKSTKITKSIVKGSEIYYVKAVDVNGKVSAASNLAKASECFVAGTPILMADYTYKMIEEVKVGEKVKSYNFKTATYCDGTVIKVATGYTTRIAMVLLEDGTYLAMSEGHPLYTRNGWRSLTNVMGYPTLVVGDKVLGSNKYVAIQDILVVDTEPVAVYSLGVTVSSDKKRFDGAYFAGIAMTLASHGGGSN